MKYRRWLSLGLTAVLVVSACGCSGNTETIGENVEETAEGTVEAAEIIQKAVRQSSKGTAEKEETVYVNADARGNVQNITVSSWLKNSSGAAELTDVTELTDVVNIKGDETFTQDGDTYVWAADGNDIYYQGGTSKALPVEVKVTYYLDGKEIDPEELAGKSGKVKIRFDYENRTVQDTIVGDKEAKLSVPFVAASTMILDSDKFVNLEVENGRILSDGKNTIVAGVAMPGLYDSLDLMNLEGFEGIDIPDYVEVTADVTDFELAMTATILMPDALDSLNTDDMDGFDDLKADIEELNDATYDLIDGCIELDDGVKELKDNMPDLQSGAAELDDGAKELDDGAKELDDGAAELNDGARELNDGAKDIRDGAKELDKGAGALQSGAGLLNERMPELTGGVNALAAGLKSLQAPMMLGPDGQSGNAEYPYIKTSVGLLKNGVDSLAAGVSSMGNTLKQAIAENQKKMQEAEITVGLLKAELEQEAMEAAQIQKQLEALAQQNGLSSSGSGAAAADSAQAALAEEPAAVQEEALSQAPEAAAEETSAADPSIAAEKGSEEGMPGISEETSAEESEELSEFARSYLDSLNAAEGMTSMSMTLLADQGSGAFDSGMVISAYQDVVGLQGQLIAKLQRITELQNQLQEAAAVYAALKGADEALNQIASQLSAGADTDQLAQLTEGMAALERSIGQIYDGVALINRQMETLTGGAAELSQGIGALKAGTDALKDGTEKLYQGGIDLKDGTEELYDGTVELKDGTVKLKDGTQELKDGTQELKDGVSDLVDGVDELKDGTAELLDGVHEYNDDGIQKLYDAVTVDLQNLLDRVDAVADLSKDYQSFSGKSDTMEGSVKFIIETEAIELDEE